MPLDLLNCFWKHTNILAFSIVFSTWKILREVISFVIETRVRLCLVPSHVDQIGQSQH